MFTGKRRFSDLQLFKKETPELVLSCEYFETFKNTYFDVSGHDQLMLVFGAGVRRKKYHMKPNLSGQYSVFPRKSLLGAGNPWKSQRNSNMYQVFFCDEMRWKLKRIMERKTMYLA